MSPRARTSAVAGLLLAVAAAACGADDVYLAVDLKTDLVPGTDFDHVRVEVTRGSRELDPQDTTVGAESAARLMVGVRVAEHGPVPTGSYRVRVILEDGGRDLVDRIVQLDLRENTAVVVVVSASCVDVVCPQPDHPERTTCGEDGRCVDPRCTPDTPELCEDPDAGTVERDAGPPPPVDAGPPPECVDGMPCSDGDPCTHGDTCPGGRCSGTGISCNSSACVTRSCDGDATCNESFPAPPTACAEDGNVCTVDWCDGMGNCAHPNVDFFDPTYSWEPGNYWARCCGGQATHVIQDAHCGGCGQNCFGRGCVDLGFGFASCRCGSNADCRVLGGDATCYNGVEGCSEPDGRGWLCQCQTDSDCPRGATCWRVGCRHWCHYP